MSKNLAVILSLGAGVALNVGANIFSALSHRPLQHDGAYWFYVNLRDGWFNWSGPLLDRIFNGIWQAPAVLLINIAGERDWLWLELLTFELSYCLHPFLSLGLTAWICRSARVPWMFLFPLASYATATNLTHGYAVGEIPTALTLFWPLFLIVLLKPFSPPRNRLATAALTLALATTHSWAFPLFLVLLFPTLAPLLKRAPRPRVEALVQAALFLAAALWLFYLGAVENRGHAYAFLSTLSMSWGALTAILVPGSMAFAALAFLGAPRSANVRRILWAALAYGSIYAYWYLISSMNGRPWEARATTISFYGRIPAVPVACLLALALFLIHRRVPRSAWSQKARWRLAAASLVPLLLIGGLSSIGQVLSWRESLNFLRAAMERDPRPCFVMSARDYDFGFYSRGNWALGLPALSMLIQGTREPKQIVAHELYVRDAIRRDFCSRAAKGLVAWQTQDDDLTQARHLSLDRIRDAMKRSR